MSKKEKLKNGLGPGMSYLMPDGTWRTIPLGATGKKVSSVQAEFWLAWGEHHRNRRLNIKSPPVKLGSPAKK